MVPVARLHLKHLILWAVPLVGLACGDGSTDIALPSLSITTATTGAELDANGYSVQIDVLTAQPIGLQETVTVDGLTDGLHSVTLLDVAPNCSAADNPRSVTVTRGATASLAFAVVCGSATGSLEVITATTGQPADPDGFVVVVDGAPSNAIGPTATVTFPGIATGVHIVELNGVAPNCQVTGDHPLGVAVEPGETATVSFTINCVATAGGLAVAVSGLPTGTAAAVMVSGPNSFSAALTGTASLTGLAPGTYSIAATNVVANGTTYRPSVGRPTVDVVAGGIEAITISYTAVATLTLNLRIDGLYITQSSQTYGSEVPLVAGRDAFLRVFVVANDSNSAKPRVRVVLTRPGASAQTFNIAAPGASTPTQVQDGVLGSSWNLRLPASLIQSGLSVAAEVDPNTEISESNETDNRFPTTGTKTLTVRGVPPARIRFVSVQQGSSTPGNVSAANKDQLMDMTRRMYPLKDIDADVDPAVFTASVPLEANGNGWNQLLSDLEGKRVDEGTNRTYYGVVKVGYQRQDGMVGLTLGAGLPTAAGWDDAGDAPRVVAHELGHTWGRRHTLCGSPPAGTIDQLYPYPDGQIGINGLDVANTAAKPVSSPDIMGYCFQNPWISDYTYRGVMDFRQASSSVVLTGAPQPSLLVWGRIVNGRPVLEPAFQIVTRPSLPRRPGPYSVTATAADGTQLFALSFDAAPAEDSPQGSRHFAFAVPFDQARAARLASLRLAGPGGRIANSRSTASLRSGAGGAPVTSRREGQSVVLQWDASVHPTIMVRDPDTGNVLTFARGGNARVWTNKDHLDLEVSDGVQSQRVRLAINRS